MLYDDNEENNEVFKGEDEDLGEPTIVGLEAVK